MTESDLETIRSTVKRYLMLRQHGSALYWADKAVCLSKGSVSDIIALTEAMFHCGQYHRAIAVLSGQEAVRDEVYARFLIAQCLCKCGEHVEALQVLENIDFFQQTAEGLSSNSFIAFHSQEISSNLFDKLDKPSDLKTLKPSDSNFLPNGVSASMLTSNIVLLKGNINEALNNLPAAAYWYKEAFRLDPFCYEAFEKLTKLEVISADDDKLLGKLEVHCGSSTLSCLTKALYLDKLPKPGVIEIPHELSIFKCNCDVLVNLAERLLLINYHRRCFKITSRVLKDDPYHPDCLPIHVSALRMLHQPNELFILANRLVRSYPESAIAWFATGSYYLTALKNDLAKRHLRKATQLDRRFGPAWLALGHAYAADNEHDQAIAAYCTAAQIVRSSHVPMMYIGVEYSASNNYTLAERFLQYARQRSPNDPAILHELGTLAFKSKRYPEALELLKQAYASAHALSDQVLAPYWEPLLNNLAHVYRELEQYDEALKMHSAALNLVENSPSTLEAMGLIYAMTNRFEEAVRAFQTTISLHACLEDNKFASKMLRLCMKQYVKSLDSQSGEPTKTDSVVTGRDICESPPASAFTLIPLEKLSTDYTSSGIPSITADSDVAYHLPTSKDNEVGLSLLEDKDVSMDSA